MRGEDRPVALACVDQQKILRRLLSAICESAVAATRFYDDCFGIDWTFDRAWAQA